MRVFKEHLNNSGRFWPECRRTQAQTLSKASWEAVSIPGTSLLVPLLLDIWSQTSSSPSSRWIGNVFGVSGDLTALSAPTDSLSVHYTHLLLEKHGGARKTTLLHRSPFKDGWDCPLGRKGQYIHITAWVKLLLIRGQRSLQGTLGVYFCFRTVKVEVDLLYSAMREDDNKSFY